MEKHFVNANNEIARKYTIKEIFAENWSKFVRLMALRKITIRQSIVEEVEKVIGCQDPNNGFALYVCPKCGFKKRVPFTCNTISA